MLRTFVPILPSACLSRHGAAYWTFVRLFAGLALFTIVFAARTAGAVTRVPMCGEHAETLTAPPISRPLPASKLVAGPCEEPSAASRVSEGLPERQKEPKVASELVPRLLPIAHDFSDAPRARSSLGTSDDTVERPAHGRGIDRPPR